MAEYILKILKSQIVVMWSWGAHNFRAIDDGLEFLVQGFKFKGTVRVKYNGGNDLFDITFLKGWTPIETIEGIYLDSLVRTIDNYVEVTEDYEQRVEQEYCVI